MADSKSPAGSFFLTMYQEYLTRWRPGTDGRRMKRKRADSILKAALIGAVRRRPLGNVVMEVYELPQAVAAAIKLVRGRLPSRYDDDYIKELLLSVTINQLPEVELAKFVEGHLSKVYGDLSMLFEPVVDLNDPQVFLEQMICFLQVLDEAMPYDFWELQLVKPLFNNIRTVRAERRMLGEANDLSIIAGVDGRRASRMSL